LARATHNDVLNVVMCPKMRPVGVTKKGKTDRNYHASNWLFSKSPRRHSPWNCCLPGRVWEVVICFKFHESRSGGFGATDGRKSLSPNSQGPWFIQHLVLQYNMWL